MPWAFDDEAVDITRRFTRLKMSLMPYLAGVAAAGAGRSGTPMLRPMVLEFPDDPATEHLDTQYMLGDSLLVAPVFSAGRHGAVLRPGRAAGRICWTAARSPARGGSPADHGFDSLPLLVRPGTVLPIGARDDRPDYDYADGVALRLFGTARDRRADGAGARRPAARGLDVRRRG